MKRRGVLSSILKGRKRKESFELLKALCSVIGGEKKKNDPLDLSEGKKERTAEAPRLLGGCAQRVKRGGATLPSNFKGRPLERSSICSASIRKEGERRALAPHTRKRKERRESRLLF